MTGLRVIAVVTGVLLTVPLGGLVTRPAPAAAQDRADVPCPSVELDDPPDAPTPPDPPPHAPGDRELGGPELATAGLVVPPGAPQPPALTARTWLVADLDTGAVLGGCGPHEYAIPASTQKLLLAAAYLDALDPERIVEVTREDLNFEPGSSAVGLVEGGEYSVETLWLGLLLNSGNDAANVLARLGGGADGVAGGLRGMNQEAHRLGAYQTHAATPSGLDGPGQFTSAYDLALIARKLFDRQDFLRYAQTERTDIPAQPDAKVVAGRFQIQNDNGLLLNYPGALGGKTGYTDLARHSFVGAAERDGRRLVVTVLGAERLPLRGWEQAAELLDWGFALPPGASVGKLVEPEELAEVATSSTQQPTSPPPATGAPAAVREEPEVGAVNAATVGGGLFAVAAVAMVALAVAGRRRRS